MPNEPLLTVSNISFEIDGQAILKKINFTLHAGQRIAIAGETGSGKSSLLKIMAGLEQPTTGEVKLNNIPVRGPNDTLVPGHARIAYLSQHFVLQKFLRVEQILEYANRLSKTAAHNVFSVCRINHLMHHKTHELSGGEMQRIAIAHLLIQQPMILLLDEPYSHLDIPLKNILKQVVNEIGEKLKISCLLVSHDPTDILPWADEIIILKKGQVVQRGSSNNIYTNPVSEYVAGLLGTYTLIDGSWIKRLGIKTKNKQIFVRPEDFEVAKRKDKSHSAIVIKINYLGSHSTLAVEIRGKVFLINERNPNITIGQKLEFRYKGK